MDHGTYGGYQVHRRAGEKACGACQRAKRDYDRSKRDRDRVAVIETPDGGAVAAPPADSAADALRDNLRRLESVIPVVQVSDPTRLTPLLKERRETVAQLSALTEDAAKEASEDEFTRARRERAERASGA